MLAGLWGEGRAPLPLQLVPLAEGRILDAGEFTVDCFRVHHRDTERFAFSFESRVRRHILPTAFRLTACRTDRCARIWRKGCQSIHTEK